MDEKQFNEENLITVFDLIKRRFPTPSRLMITVHTNLATIETLEENEMAKDSIDSRFGKIYLNYKRAHFSRFENGREGFLYTTRLNLEYQQKLVIIKEGNKNA